MKSKKTKIITSTVALASILAIGIGAGVGIINLNKSQTTTNNKNIHKSLSQIINNTAPSLYLKNPSFVASQKQNSSFNPITQNTVYLDPNLNILNLSGVSSIEYTWHATNQDFDYGGFILGNSNSANNQGIFELNTYELTTFKYVFFSAIVNLTNGTTESFQSKLLTLNNTTTISGNLQVTNNEQPVTIISDQLSSINTSDPYELSINNEALGSSYSASDITYEWYGALSANAAWQEQNTEFINPNGWINLNNTGSTSSNKLLLNTNIVQAGFTNFAVVILANGVRVGLLKTSIVYSHNAPITNTSISFSGSDVKNDENYVYPSQTNNFSSINVGFNFEGSLNNTTATINYYGFNSTTNTYMTNNSNPGFTLLGSKEINSIKTTNNTASFALNASDSYYQEYYATITVGNYQYTTSKIINNILSNNDPVSTSPTSSNSTPKSATSNDKPVPKVKSSSTVSGTTPKSKTTSSKTAPTKVAKPKVIIPTVTEKLNTLDTSELLSQNNISSLSSYYSDYSSSSFESNLIKDLISTSNVSITNIAYNASEITSITFKNNTLNNLVIDWSDGTKLLTLSPKETGSIGVDIPIVNQYSFANLNKDILNLTTLWHQNNTGAVDYFNEMYKYSWSEAYNIAVVYGFLSTNINSSSELNNFNFNVSSASSATKITSSSWNTWYSSSYPSQQVELSWMADILGINTTGFDGYAVYIANNSTIYISQVDYHGTWYDVNYTINLGGRFTLNWNTF